MEFKKTPHINAEQTEISDIVLMPGDPLRAKMIAEVYLDDYKLVNKVRNMYAYTGYYKGKKITVMGSGMGTASIGIYSYELFKFYNVNTIIRIGSCGAYQKELNIFDVILVDKAYSESSYAKVQNNEESELINSNDEINEKILEAANKNNISLNIGTIHTSDVFYQENNQYEKLVEKYNCLGVEMEAFALFHNAKVLNKKAACLLTVSDSFITNEVTSSAERETKLNEMILIALESTLLL